MQPYIEVYMQPQLIHWFETAQQSNSDNYQKRNLCFQEYAYGGVM